MARKTKTPKWISIVRKLWAYLGNTTLESIYAADMINDHQAVVLGIIFNGVGFAIQVICDAYGFAPEKPSDFKPEPNEIKE
jgi:hypothetical protein